MRALKKVSFITTSGIRFIILFNVFGCLRSGEFFKKDNKSSYYEYKLLTLENIIFCHENVNIFT